ncbi:MAG: hypothetical protein ACRDN0_16515 [Trebonia sp.]
MAIEEHHVIPEMSSSMDLSWVPSEVQGRLRVIQAAERLADMDAAGIDMQVLSVVLPMPRMLPAETAVPLAVKANEELHDMVTAHPDRFAAFATLPVTVPDAAADAAELERVRSVLSSDPGNRGPAERPGLPAPRPAAEAGRRRVLHRLQGPGQPAPGHRRLRMALRDVAARSPFADNRRATDWFDRLNLTPEVREKIAHGTADKLLRLR